MKTFYKIIILVFILSGCKKIGPVISINQSLPREFEVLSEEPNWVDYFNVTDDLDGEIKLNEGLITENVNMNKVGVYEVKVNVIDTDEIESSKSITINVIDLPPVIDIVKNNFILEAGDDLPNFKEYFKITDNTDGSIEVTDEMVSNNVDMNNAGNYTVNLAVTDSANNLVTETIDILVEDKPAVVSLTKELVVEAGNDEPNWTNYININDKVDGTIEVTNEMIQEEVDMNQSGVYNLYVSVIDSFNNETIEVFEVIVKDLEPIVKAVNNNSTILSKGSKEPNWHDYFYVYDKVDGNIYDLEIGSNVNMNKTGFYEVTVKAEDSNSNFTYAKMTVSVVEPELIDLIKKYGGANAFVMMGYNYDIIERIANPEDIDVCIDLSNDYFDFEYKTAINYAIDELNALDNVNISLIESNDCSEERKKGNADLIYTIDDTIEGENAYYTGEAVGVALIDDYEVIEDISYINEATITLAHEYLKDYSLLDIKGVALHEALHFFGFRDYANEMGEEIGSLSIMSYGRTRDVNSMTELDLYNFKWAYNNYYNDSLIPLNDYHYVFYENDGSISKLLIKSKEVVIPDYLEDTRVKVIGPYSFTQKEIFNLTIGNYVKEINEAAFYKNNIKELIIPDSVIIISKHAFRENEIHTLTLGDSLDSIGESAFYNNNIIELTFPDSLISIKDHAFRDNEIETLIIGNNINEIGISAFYNNKIKELILPDSLSKISSDSFRSNDIEILTLGSNVTEIGASAFYDNNINELIIPNTVTKINDLAFQFNNITELVIPESVESIGFNAFGNNPLTSITILGDETRFNDSWDIIGFPSNLKSR